MLRRLNTMDAAKRKRTQFRREFTITAERLVKDFTSNNLESVEANYSTLYDIVDNLFKCEEQIRDLWCELENFDELTFQIDQDIGLEYRQKWSHLKIKFAKFATGAHTEVNNSLVSVKSIPDKMYKRLLNMPKLEIVKFDGNIRSWLLFWGQFKKIHTDENIDNADKFQYLLQSMAENSKARTLVESYPPCGENYFKAVEALKARFARDDMLIEVYVRSLLSLIQEKALYDFTEQYDKLQADLQALETLGVTEDKYAFILIPMIESSLPDDILKAWNRFKYQDGCKKNLQELLNFIRQEVEAEERIKLIRQHFSGNADDVSTKTTQTPNEATACLISKANTRNEVKLSNKICVWCNKNSHSSSECYKATAMTQRERLDFLTSKNACEICLRTNHITKNCKSYLKCLFCKKRHITLMCPYRHDNASENKKDERLFTRSNVGDIDEVDANSRNVKLKYWEKNREHFRHRLKKEYISIQVENINRNTPIKRGDEVLIEFKDSRINWPLGVIEDIVESFEQGTKVTRIRTTCGIKIRPVDHFANNNR